MSCAESLSRAGLPPPVLHLPPGARSLELKMITGRGSERSDRHHVCRRAPSAHDETPVARVAIMALPVRVDVLAEVVEDEPRPTLRTLTVGNHRLELGAILDAPLLVVGEIGAEVDLRQLVLHAFPTATPIFAYESVTFEQHENDARLAPRDA